jgi:hypothetical protein
MSIIEKISDFFFTRYAVQSLKNKELETQISILQEENKNLKSELHSCHAALDVLQKERQQIPPGDIITTDMDK